jgi:hypothetical protein
MTSMARQMFTRAFLAVFKVSNTSRVELPLVSHTSRVGLL